MNEYEYEEMAKVLDDVLAKLKDADEETRNAFLEECDVINIYSMRE